jgi:hypothetical protein
MNFSSFIKWILYFDEMAAGKRHNCKLTIAVPMAVFTKRCVFWDAAP